MSKRENTNDDSFVLKIVFVIKFIIRTGIVWLEKGIMVKICFEWISLGCQSVGNVWFCGAGCALIEFLDYFEMFWIF
jgi:hypothetical protein